jgi:NAD(P)-dependent dehydrogenase (short-subunit alcohol dehydrogenase family)
MLEPQEHKGTAVEFQNKTVVVTGAGKGIGRATSLAFAREGANLVIADLDESALQQTTLDIRNSGGVVEAVTADCADESGVRDYLNAAANRYGRIDALFCNAGVRGRIAPITACEESDFDAILRINLRSVFLGLRLVTPIMAEQRSGSVVVTASTAALAGLASMPGYVATKHGVLGLVRAAAVDMARYGVRVNALLPGATKTPLLMGLYALSSPANPAAAAERYASTVPTGRLIEPEEIAAMSLYLCSEKARSITGAYFLVDGGRTIGAGMMTTTAGMQEGSSH